MTLPGQPYPLSVRNPCRHVDRERATLERPSFSCAVLAGLLRDPAVPTTALADPAADELAERRAGNRLQLARAAANGARDDRRAGFRAVAMTRPTAHERIEVELPGRAMHHLLERDLDRGGDVVAGYRARAAVAEDRAERVAATEERLEDVGEAREVAE